MKFAHIEQLLRGKMEKLAPCVPNARVRTPICISRLNTEINQAMIEIGTSEFKIHPEVFADLKGLLQDLLDNLDSADYRLYSDNVSWWIIAADFGPSRLRTALNALCDHLVLCEHLPTIS